MKSFALRLFTIFIAIYLATAYTDPTLCTASTDYYDVATLNCTTCPANTQMASDFTFCNCSNTHYDNPDVIGFNNAQSCLTAPSTYTVATQIVSPFNLDGSSSVTVETCASAYPNSLNNKCIPCGPSTTYSATLGCTCNNANEYWVAGGCYINVGGAWSSTNSPTTATANYLVQRNAVIGCGQHNIIQACNQLYNKCVQNNYAISDFFCQLLSTYQQSQSPSTGLPVYTFSGQITDSISIYASSLVGTNTTDTKNTIQIILAQYNQDGSLNDVKSLDDSIFRCYLNSQDIVNFQSFGLQFSKTCNTLRTFSNKYYYDVYVKDINGNYNQVPILIDTTYYKRFTPSSFNSLQLTLLSVPPLRVPYLTASNQSSAQIRTVSNAQSTSINYLPFLAIFAVVILVFFILDFYRYNTYNPDEKNDPYYCFNVIGYFFLNIIKYAAVGFWFWLLALSTYCFCFYKFQQTVYLILPPPNNDTTGLYSNFAAFFYTTYSLTIVAIFIQFFKLVNFTNYFMIDWQKEKEMGKFEMGRNRRQASVWRKVLVVNELYELSMGRLMNIEFVSLLSIMFLQGLNWINLSFNIPNTSPLVSDSIRENNHILVYFIITFVIFSIALIQFILRHAVKTWFPLPIEDFVDLCSVCNVSIIMFDQALHGYYIHGMNPMGQSQGSLQYIQNMFQKQAKSFGKSRSFKLQDTDQCQTYEMIVPLQIRTVFQVKYVSNYNNILGSKNYATSTFPSPVPQNLSDQDYKQLQKITMTMLQTFKFYLQGIKASNFNVKERSLWEKVIDCPVDTEGLKLPIFIKDKWYQFSNTMVSGHQFLLLFNFINFVNIFWIATKNVYMAFLIAFVFEKIIFFLIGIFLKRNISKSTLIDDKFFN